MKNISPQSIAEIGLKACYVIMKHYKKQDLKTIQKADNSLVTEADYACSTLITEALYKLYPKIPTISEEDDEQKNINIVQSHDLFWLIDPIDGTWSFVNHCGDFAVNIALIENGIPVFGLIGAPLHGTIYYNDQDKVYKLQDGNLKEIRPNKYFSHGLDFLVSDSNMNQRTQDFINNYQIKTITPVPSAYKFALMCEGKGDIYPRFKRTYTWDTAAGHAMLRNVGGDIFGLNYQPLKYNQGLVNPDFIATVNTKLILKKEISV